MTPAFIPDVFDLNVDPNAIGPATPRNLHFTPKSASVGLIQKLPYDLVASVTAQYVERAPKPAELFSRGGHDATATFDIGNPNLGIETAKSIEVGLRRAAGPLRFELTGYYTKFNGFIFRRLNGNTCDGSTACVDAVHACAGSPVFNSCPCSWSHCSKRFCRRLAASCPLSIWSSCGSGRCSWAA